MIFLHHMLLIGLMKVIFHTLQQGVFQMHLFLNLQLFSIIESAYIKQIGSRKVHFDSCKLYTSLHQDIQDTLQLV